MLEAKGVSAAYGEAEVLHDVSIEVGDGEIVAMLGPNGAGKTTLAKALMRLIPISAGQLRLGDTDLTHLPRHQVAEAGLALVPEGRRLFTMLTVEENLELGAYSPGPRRELKQTMAMVYELFPRLRDRQQQLAGTLSGGEQQMVALGRGLMAKPKFLIMDEPSLGLSPALVDTMFELIQNVVSLGVGVLLVEQNVARTLEIAARGYVLEQGRIVQHGSREDLLGSTRIREAYLAL
ncbi:MAG TPA: ABC transporter ATP-binding protein [Egicoccus sp.]|nr:ABC transporter ATP-binding protein [Egicoccus sp.]HSK23043.1 ABC transporter ATP-binding protein [Egicoccus sp.]